MGTIVAYGHERVNLVTLKWVRVIPWKVIYFIIAHISQDSLLYCCYSQKEDEKSHHISDYLVTLKFCKGYPRSYVDDGTMQDLFLKLLQYLGSNFELMNKVDKLRF